MPHAPILRLSRLSRCSIRDTGAFWPRSSPVLPFRPGARRGERCGRATLRILQPGGYTFVPMRLAASVLVAIALASSGAVAVTAQSRTPAPSSSDAPPEMAPCSISALQRHVSSASSENGDALTRLALQQAKWKAQRPTSYRLCVATLNPLLFTLTETEVVGGMIRVARQASNIGPLKEPLEAEHWSASAGLSVEMLFDRVERALTSMQAPLRPGYPRLVTTTRYDRTFGYPVHTHTGPAPSARIADLDVTTLIRLTPWPAVPLTPASSGEVYLLPRRGRIVHPDRIYDSLLGLVPTESEAAIRTLWPALASTILAHGNARHWKRLNWTPQTGMAGTILGTFKHPSGQSLYLMAFHHNDQTLYLPIEMNGVAVSR